MLPLVKRTNVTLITLGNVYTYNSQMLELKDISRQLCLFRCPIPYYAKEHDIFLPENYFRHEKWHEQIENSRGKKSDRKKKINGKQHMA